MPTKVCLVKAMVFPVVMYGCEGWTIKKAECWRTDAFELVFKKTLESLLDCKEIKPVNPKGNQYWVIGGTDAEAEAPILWLPDVKNWFSGKDWRQQEKGTTEDEMAGWHYWLDGQEFEQAPGVGDGQGSLACPQGHNSQTQLSDWTERITRAVPAWQRETHTAHRKWDYTSINSEN